MSLYGSQKGLNGGQRVGSKSDLTGGANQFYTRTEFVQGPGPGFEPYMDGYSYTIRRSAADLGMSGAGGAMR